MTAIRWTAAAASAALLCGTLAVAEARGARDSVTLTGCLIKGDGGDGFLLINANRGITTGSVEERRATPGTVGTTGAVANIFYWLDKDGDLTPHIGHQVEIQGDVKGPLRDGEIKVDRKDQWTEIEVKSDGRGMKARVPNESVVAGPTPDRKLDVLVRRVDVDKVKMLDAVCR